MILSIMYLNLKLILINGEQSSYINHLYCIHDTNINSQYRLDRKLLNKEIYWENEAPVFDAGKLEAILQSFNVDTVITHSAPSFCELTTKFGLSN